MKRTLSESDSDDGDFNDQEQEQSEDKDMESGEASARKKRRGLIEKKRRDRINTCLAELRRLVPAAVERQGSAKLEKAEILQLTVEHLKAMKNAGTVGQGESLMRNCTDYRSVGFQRCMAETARYLTYRMDTPEVNNPPKCQRTDQINNETQQSLTGQPTQKTAGLNTPSALPQPVQAARPSQNYNFTSPESSKTNSTVDNERSPRYELNNKNSPSSNESAHLSRQGLQFSFPFKHPAVLPIHAPDIMSFPLSFLSPAMTEWPFSVATKSNMKTPPTLFGPWCPQLFGSQTSNIAF